MRKAYYYQRLTFLSKGAVLDIEPNKLEQIAEAIFHTLIEPNVLVIMPQFTEGPMH